MSRALRFLVLDWETMAECNPIGGQHAQRPRLDFGPCAKGGNAVRCVGRGGVGKW